ARAHVLVLILQLDLLGDGDPILGDRGRAEALLQDDVAALGAERDPNGAGQLGDAPPHGLAGLLIERDLLRSHSASSVGFKFAACGFAQDAKPQAASPDRVWSLVIRPGRRGRLPRASAGRSLFARVRGTRRRPRW